MNRFLPALLTCLVIACTNPEPPATATVAERETVAVQYVGAEKLDVRSTADDSAEVIATYPNGEAVSVLGHQGEWTEIRTGDRSGWARTAGLIDGAAATAQENDTTLRFRRPPLPVVANGARGEIYLEANVNTDGGVSDVKVLANTTGSQALLERNIASLRQAQFFPMTKKGERKTFKYYHRATY